MSLKSGIRQTEHRIGLRRARLGVALDGVKQSLGRRMVSPGALVTACLFGAALHQNKRLHGLRMLTLVEAVNTSLRLLLSMSSRAQASAATR